jgi:hypothetical protein
MYATAKIVAVVPVFDMRLPAKQSFDPLKIMVGRPFRPFDVHVGPPEAVPTFKAKLAAFTSKLLNTLLVHVLTEYEPPANASVRVSDASSHKAQPET